DGTRARRATRRGVGLFQQADREAAGDFREHGKVAHEEHFAEAQCEEALNRRAARSLEASSRARDRSTVQSIAGTCKNAEADLSMMASWKPPRASPLSVPPPEVFARAPRPAGHPPAAFHSVSPSGDEPLMTRVRVEHAIPLIGLGIK